MKKIGKIIVFIIIGLIVVVGALIGYVELMLPNVGDAPNIKVEITPDRVERGKYLVNHVAACTDCHSPKDWSKFGSPINMAKFGAGGDKFDKEMGGFPGEISAPNITPYRLKGWTDGELFRGITTGVTKDGAPMFPFMPYTHYGKVDSLDIIDMIAYIRTLPSIESPEPIHKLDFPLNIIDNMMPAKASFTKKPSKTDQVAYGGYLVKMGSCGSCHTQMDEQGNEIKGMEFAGGSPIVLPNGTLYSSNITPHPETGIGKWTKEQFIKRFKMYADSSYKPASVGPKDMQTMMPWGSYSGMGEEDLGAIYDYLKSLKPVKNKVTVFVPKSKG